STFHPGGSLQESVARKSHDYGMRRILMTPEKYGLMLMPPQEQPSNPSGLNVYGINFGGEHYWICAGNFIEAIRTMIHTIGVSFDDFDKEDSIEIIPPEKWHILRIVDTEAVVEEGEEPPLLETVGEWMARAT